MNDTLKLIDLHIELRNLMQAGRGIEPMVRNARKVFGQSPNGRRWFIEFDTYADMAAWATGTGEGKSQVLVSC